MKFGIGQAIPRIEDPRLVTGRGRYTDDIDVLNFSKIADAFEIDFRFIAKSADLEKEIKSILEVKGPCLIELLCDPNQEILNPFQINAT